jgi:cell filamentation protein, protein adenylyltransferase
MVLVKKRSVGKQDYYYIEHSIRKDNKVIKKEKYLGKKLPKNINELKKDFFLEILRNKWIPLFDIIKKNYIKEYKTMPKIGKDKLIEDFVINFTYDSQRIEGSTLTLRETADLLLDGISPNKPIKDVKEAESHKKVFIEMIKDKGELTLNKVLEWHKMLMKDTKPKIAGKIRNHRVKISGSKFVPSFSSIVKTLLKDFFKWYNQNNKLNPVELAALVHLKFVTIHPFTDGNGRISRLMMNFVLNKNKYPLMNIEYKNRTSYYNSLVKSQVKKEDLTFLKWFFKNYIKQNKLYSK